MTEDLHIVAVGARTPLGLGAASSAAAFRAGLSRVGEHPMMVDGAGDPLRCAWDAQLEPAVFGAHRLVDIGVTALAESIDQLFFHRPPSAAVPLLLAVPEPRPGFSANESEIVVGGLAAAELPHGARVNVEAVASGRAGFFQALALAARAIAARELELCIVGGVDSYLDADTLDWLDQKKLLPREGRRGSFIPGEASAMIAVASRAASTTLGLRSLAVVRGVATAREARSRDADEGLLGEALTDVIRRAALALRFPDQPIDEIYCDVNGERQHVDDWAFAVLRLPFAFRDGTAYKSAVGAFGDVGAASGALGCVLAVQAWERRYAHGPRALVWGSSTDGLRGATVLERQGS
jgi:3-oxoacyl-[acyl-carrier-protein] synthase I